MTYRMILIFLPYIVQNLHFVQFEDRLHSVARWIGMSVETNLNALIMELGFTLFQRIQQSRLIWMQTSDSESAKMAWLKTKQLLTNSGRLICDCPGLKYNEDLRCFVYVDGFTGEMYKPLSDDEIQTNTLIAYLLCRL